MATVDIMNGLVGSAAIKVPCAIVATSNITASGAVVIGSYTTQENDRVLLTAQTNPVDNGIYVCNEDGAWARAPDFDGPYDATEGTLVVVLRLANGTSSYHGYRLTNESPVAIGEDSLTFVVTPFDSAQLGADLSASGGSDLVGHIAAGTGAVARTVQQALRERVDLYNFAEGDGSTDDTIKVNQCIAANSGKTIYLGGRTYVVSNITLIAGTVLQGPGTIKRKTASTGFMVSGSSTANIYLNGITFDGDNTGSAAQLVRIDGNSYDLTIRECIFKNSIDTGLGISGTGARVTINACRFVSNANYGMAIDASGGQHTITGCTARGNGSSGIVISANYVTCEGNKALSNATTITSQAGILLLNCNYATVNDNQAVGNGTGAVFAHGIQLNTCANSVMQGNTAVGNNGSGLDSYISTGTVIDGNQSLSNNLRGIEVDSGSTYTTVTGNVVQGNADAGISVFNTVGVTIDGNTVGGNGTLGTATNPLLGSANSPYGIALWGAGNYGNYSRVVNNMIAGNVGSGANGVGLYVHPSCVGITVWGNTFSGNTVQSALVNSNLAFAGKNFGLYFEQSGASTILNGNTSVVVSLSPALSFTPSAADITLTALQAPTNAPGELYPSAVTASGFTINCRNNPGASNLSVAWRVAKESF